MDLPFPEPAPNFLGIAVQARQLGQADRKARARESALGMMAGGDYEGSANALRAAGDFETAAQVDAQQQDQTRKKVLSTYRTDPAGAQAAAFGAGDPQLIDMVSKLDANQRAIAQQHAETLGAVGLKLKGIPYEQRKAALQAMAPSFAQRGFDPKQIANFDPTDQNIDVAVGQAMDFKELLAQQAKANEPFTLGKDQVRFGAGGKEIARGPDAPEYKTVKDAMGNEQIVAVGGSGVARGGQGPSLTTGGFDAIYGDFTKPHEGGYTPSDGNGVPANFGINQSANPDINVATLTPAQAKQILHDRYWVLSGAEQLPPALQAVHFDTAVNMGVDRAKQMLAASGGDPQKYLEMRDQRFRAIAAADPSKASRLPIWLQRNQDLAQYIGGQGGGAQPAAQVVYRAAPPTGGAGLYGAPDNGPQGEDFLKTLPNGYAQQVKATAKGDLAMPSSFVMKTPYGQKLIADIMQYDPTANAINLPTRQATRKQFVAGSGPSSPRGQLGSINTVTSHLATLYDAVDGLRNFTGTGVLLNPVANAVAGATDSAYQKARAKYDSALTAVAEDLPNVLRGGSGAEGDVKHWRSVFNADQSPDALKTAIRATAGDLVKARLDPLRQQYQQGMGTTDDVFQTMFPQGAAALDRIMGTASPASAPARGAPAARSPKPDPLGIR